MACVCRGAMVILFFYEINFHNFNLIQRVREPGQSGRETGKDKQPWVTLT